MSDQLLDDDYFPKIKPYADTLDVELLWLMNQSELIAVIEEQEKRIDFLEAVLNPGWRDDTNR